MARFAYDVYEKRKVEKSLSNTTNTKSKFSFFSLKNDGDEAVVRFIYNSAEEFDLVNTHVLKIGDKYKKVHCLRQPFDPLDRCPLCKAEEKASQKFFVKLIEYTQDEKGNVIATPKVWEKTLSFAKLLKSYFDEYGSINEHIFKIKRHGAKGDQGTTYDVMFANPKIFKPEIYIKDFSAFDDLDVVRMLVATKTAEEMEAYLETGEFPAVVTTTPDTTTKSAPVTATELPSMAIPTPTVVTSTTIDSTFNIKSDTESKEDPSTNRPRRTYIG